MGIIKTFKNFFNKDEDKIPFLINNILDNQGTSVDQRPHDTRKIYTKEELEELPEDKIWSIYRYLHHPRGRWW